MSHCCCKSRDATVTWVIAGNKGDDIEFKGLLRAAALPHTYEGLGVERVSASTRTS